MTWFIHIRGVRYARSHLLLVERLDDAVLHLWPHKIRRRFSPHFVGVRFIPKEETNYIKRSQAGLSDNGAGIIHTNIAMWCQRFGEAAEQTGVKTQTDRQTNGDAAEIEHSGQPDTDIHPTAHTHAPGR